MDRSTLEKLILAKLHLSADCLQLIKSYLPLNPPTPTARLMKQVSIRHFHLETCFGGTGLRIYELSGRWSAPPLRPEIQYLRKYRDVLYWRPQYWDNITGELCRVRGERRVLITWPALEPESLPTWSYYTREDADEMARRVRSWTPVSI